MAAHDDALRALREGLRLAPRNLPLRLHLAATLLEWDRPAEAEQEYRTALKQAPDHPEAKLGLARSFHAQGKTGEATVLVEDLLGREESPAAVFVLHARMLLDAGDEGRAARQYRRAVELDPDTRDEALERRLGGAPVPAMGFLPERPEDDDDEDDDDEGLVAGVERPAIDFGDVGGMEELKETIRLKIIHPLQRPEIYQAYGKSIGGGILLYGPPGCGKTHLARATAGEVGATFFAIGINDVLDMWMGQSERRMHELFQTARRNAPCVLFFDEVDALGASRSDVKHSFGRTVINQFLAELDGVKYSNEGVLVLAATNAPWHVDGAFRRPGRFDQVLFVPPPDEAGRATILEVMLRDKPVGKLDVGQVARKTSGFSGADLKAVVDTAVEAKLAEALRTGAPVPIQGKDLLAAAKRRKPTTKEWFASARNYALYANEGGMYDDILRYLGES